VEEVMAVEVEAEAEEDTAGDQQAAVKAAEAAVKAAAAAVKAAMAAMAVAEEDDDDDEGGPAGEGNDVPMSVDKELGVSSTLLV
jgi:hypothetical protein